MVIVSVQFTETSSLWLQSWLPQTLCEQAAMSVSVPRHWTSSNHIVPLPGLIFPWEYPIYLCAIGNHNQQYGVTTRHGTHYSTILAIHKRPLTLCCLQDTSLFLINSFVFLELCSAFSRIHKQVENTRFAKNPTAGRPWVMCGWCFDISSIVDKTSQTCVALFLLVQNVSTCIICNWFFRHVLT